MQVSDADTQLILQLIQSPEPSWQPMADMVILRLILTLC